MRLLIKNGRVLDPATGLDGIRDVLIEDSRVERIIDRSENGSSKKKTADKKMKNAEAVAEELKDIAADVEIDAAGCYVMPGFIDLHVHLRDPGFTHKETVETGGLAAARGGYTTICAMPNTNPVMDNKDRIAFMHRKAKAESVVNVLQIGAVTEGQNGEILADIAGMAEEGAPAISEDGKSVMNVKLYMKGMREAARYGLKVFAHCEEKNLAGSGVMHKSDRAKQLGMPQISHAVEDIITARDIIMAKEAGAALHICHVSTAESVKMVRLAKEEGLQVTAEACPHHFTLSVEDIKKDDPNFKMNPPLRDPADRQALIEGLADGTIDVIATDHAPHTMTEKGVSMIGAPFGIVGLETAASLTYTELVEKDILTPLDMAAKMSYNPAKIINSDKGTLAEGSVADVVIFDPQAEYVIDAAEFASKGRNTPFQGRKVKGKVRGTIVNGKIVYQGD